MMEESTGDLDLFIFQESIIYYDGQEYSTDSPHYLFLLDLSEKFRHTTVATRLHPDRKRANHVIRQSEKLSVVPLPFYNNVPELCLTSPIKFRKFVTLVSPHIQQAHVLWLTWPSPISLLLLMLFYPLKGKTTSINVRQNQQRLVAIRYKGASRVLAWGYVALLDTAIRLLYKNRLVAFTVGDEMYRSYIRSFKNTFHVKFPLIQNRWLEEWEQRPGNRINLLFVGRLEAEKGLPYLIQAIQILANERRDIHLDIIGNGIEQERSQKLMKELQLDEYITFHGRIAFGESLFEFYKKSDFFILPSLSEGFPNVINEARAFGLPVICTAVGGMKREIRHLQTGFLIEPHSALAIANAVKLLHTDPELKKEIIKGQLKEVEESGTRDMYVEQVARNLYESRTKHN